MVTKKILAYLATRRYSQMKERQAHKRENYEKVYNQLRVECNELKTEMDEISNYKLLQEINARLRRLNCIPMTSLEIADILDKIN